MNEKQKAWLDKFRKENEMKFKQEEDWNTIMAIHSSDIEIIYKALKSLE